MSNEAARATSQQLTNFLEQISDADNDGIVDFLENRAPLVTLQGASEITLIQGETLSDPGQRQRIERMAT